MLLSAVSSLSAAWRVFFGWAGAGAPPSSGVLMGAPAPGAHALRFHSHNDYVHVRPVWDALRHGVSSVEADIWLVDGALLVGHTRGDLRADRTLASLYLDPLCAIFEAHNKSSDVLVHGFPALSELPLQLLIDIKTDGAEAFPHLYAALAPLRAAGLLSTHVPGAPRLAPALLTVVGTGNTPPGAVAALGNATHPRDVFLDAELAALPRDADRAVAPLASTSFARAVGWHWLPFLARRRVRALVRAAHARGIQVRFWGIPSWPRGARMHVQRMLRAEGVDWLNIDDWREVRKLGGDRY